MVRKVMLFSTAALAAVALSVSPVFADQLTLGGDGTATFTGTGNLSGDVITMTTTGSSGGCPVGDTCIGSNSSGGFESPTGVNIFGGASWSFSVPQSAPLLSLQSLGGGVYTVDQNGGQTATFNFSGGGGDTVTGTIDWTSLTQSSTTNVATISGTLKVSTVTGTGTDGATFLTDFPSGYTLGIDYAFGNLGSSLSGLIGTHNSLSGTASSGEVPGAPEPTTLVLYGAGMLLVGSFFRKYRQA